MLLQTTTASGVSLTWEAIIAGLGVLLSIVGAIIGWVKITERHRAEISRQDTKITAQETQLNELYDLQAESAKQINANSLHIGKVSSQMEALKTMLEAGVYPKKRSPPS